MNCRPLRTQLFVIAMVAAVGTTAMAESITAKVIGQRVNLRAKAAPTAEVVSQVSDGDILKVKSVGDEWVEVVPPDAVEFWVHRDFVVEGGIVGNKVNVRAGPGINYTVVGTLDRGSAIESKGAFGEWVRIGAFDDASLWISKDLVELAYPFNPPSGPAPTVASVPGPEPVPPESTQDTPATPTMAQASTSPATTNEPPKATTDVTSGAGDLRLVPLEGQGRKSVKEGTVKLTPILLRKAGSHRLVVKEGVRLVNVCYLRGNSAQLSGFEDVPLRIHGREFWAQGFRDPILVVELIERLPATP